MGIDIGFTDESLSNSRYAACRKYRKRIVGFHAKLTEGADDPVGPYREQDRVLNLTLLQQEEPQLYQLLTKNEPPIFRRDTMSWYSELPGKYGIKGKDAARLKRYVESRPSTRVYLRKMPKELADEWIAKASKEDLISSWYDLAYDRQNKICRPCPIRPLDENRCYIRFSNYPGMNSFRQGFLHAILYSATIDEDELKQALFSFPHVNRSKGQLPRDKVAELMEMCRGTPVNTGAEAMFNNFVEMLDKIKPEELVSTAEKVRSVDIPFVDEFISKYIYRNEPYQLEETRKLLPYIETVRELAEWALFDTDNRALRSALMGFKSRFDGLLTALKIADKYGLEVSMSY